MPQTVGVCAIQGDFEKHLASLLEIGLRGMEVRTQEDLALVDKLILPGGESTTVGLLMQRFGLGEAIIDRVRGGMPVWGTCMGMILLAKEIEGRPNQWTLDLLDVTVRRNAFGAQVNSFESEINIVGLPEPIMGVFIRAPIVTRCGPGVEVLADIDDAVVAVRQGHILGTSFHPEITNDTRMHQWFSEDF